MVSCVRRLRGELVDLCDAANLLERPRAYFVRADPHEGSFERKLRLMHMRVVNLLSVAGLPERPRAFRRKGWFTRGKPCGPIHMRERRRTNLHEGASA